MEAPATYYVLRLTATAAGVDGFGKGEDCLVGDIHSWK
jgi:hypothetical protein